MSSSTNRLAEIKGGASHYAEEHAAVGEAIAKRFAPAQTIVVQPTHPLTQDHSQAFQEWLESAIAAAGESIVVDLLWIETSDAAGISALVSGLEKATRLGKILSFQSMQQPLRVAVELEWERQRQQRLGATQELWNANLAQFLGENRKR